MQPSDPPPPPPPDAPDPAAGPVPVPVELPAELAGLAPLPVPPPPPTAPTSSAAASGAPPGGAPGPVTAHDMGLAGHTGAGTSAAPPPGRANAPSAVPALVMGLLGILLCPLVGVGGIVLARRARDEIAAEPMRYGGAGLATAGLVCGVAGLFVGTIGTFILLVPILAGASA